MSIAENLFRERGFAATSMRDLASEVGIEPASLYNHYSSKEALLHKICFGIAEQFFGALEEIEKIDLPPDEKLRKAIILHVGVIKENSDAFAVFLHDWRYLSEPSLSEFRQARRDYEEIYRGILQDGVRAGIFQDIDVKFMTLTLFSALNWIYHWFTPSGSMTPKEIGENLSHLIIDGIKN
jgi:AcrR family transcriptional regulator